MKPHLSYHGCPNWTSSGCACPDLPAAPSSPTPRTDALFPMGPLGVPETKKTITELAEEFGQLKRELAQAQDDLRVSRGLENMAYDQRDKAQAQLADMVVNPDYSAARSSIADTEAKAFGEGVLAAAKEVESHWNDSNAMVNQRDQALRSADVLRRLPLARRRTW